MAPSVAPPKRLSPTFRGIHTTAQLVVYLLFEIATQREYVQPLRQEIEDALAAYGGWNKAAIKSMLELDRFVKECQTEHPLDAGESSFHDVRSILTHSQGHYRVICDFQFFNGIRIHKGT
ncbi:hypothetical protein BDW66DRAFT_155475 [Aspergillus desertorum]